MRLDGSRDAAYLSAPPFRGKSQRETGIDVTKAQLKKFKALHPGVPTKSGLMVGLGETDEEILTVMRDMRAHGIDMLTIGQYLAPTTSHLPVRRYVHPDTFKMFEAKALEMGFSHAAVGAMVRSSYHADQQAHAAGVSIGA